MYCAKLSPHLLAYDALEFLTSSATPSSRLLPEKALLARLLP